MIDWCTVNGDLKKTLRVPGPVTGPLGSWGTLHASDLAWPGTGRCWGGGTWIWIYKMLLVSPRRLWVGVRMSASLCHVTHVTGVTHVSHTFASRRKYHEDAPVTDSRCHPGPVQHWASSWQTNWLDDWWRMIVTQMWRFVSLTPNSDMCHVTRSKLGHFPTLIFCIAVVVLIFN